MAARSEEKARAAMRELSEDTGNTDLHYLKLDLADLTTIKSTVDQFSLCAMPVWSN